MRKIRIYTDENVDIAIAEGLKRRGVEVFTARDTKNIGLTDEEQLNYTIKNQFIIFIQRLRHLDTFGTHDDDFLILADKWKKQGKEHYGIIYADRQKVSVGKCIRKLELIVGVLSPEDMKNHVEFL